MALDESLTIVFFISSEQTAQAFVHAKPFKVHVHACGKSCTYRADVHITNNNMIWW